GIELGDHARIVLDDAADDVDELARSCQMRCQPREVRRLDSLEARIRQTDGVYHSLIELGDTRGRVADARLERYRFGREAADGLEVHHVSQLDAVACRAGGEDDRILKGEIGDGDGEAFSARHARLLRSRVAHNRAGI